MQKAMETALVLVEAGAEVHRRNADGKRPVDVLVQVRQSESVLHRVSKLVSRLPGGEWRSALDSEAHLRPVCAAE